MTEESEETSFGKAVSALLALVFIGILLGIAPAVVIVVWRALL